MATTKRAKARQPKSERPAKPDKATLIPPETNSLMGRAAVAAALDVSIRVFAEMVHDGDFPPAPLRAGKSPRWTREMVNAWIKEQIAKEAR